MKIKMGPSRAILLPLILLPLSAASAQGGFGFDNEPDTAAAKAASAPILAASGEISVGGILFRDDLDAPDSAVLDNATAAKLNLSLAGPSADLGLKLKLTEKNLGIDDTSDFLDDAVEEAYLRLFLGPVTMEGGLLKVSWGKADSQGPLDVLNPYDLTDLTVLDTLERKIAEPMIHVSWSLGSMSKLEAVYLPSFEGYKIASGGRWVPSKIEALETSLVAFGAADGEAAYLAALPDTDALDYSQCGVRFTTTTGSVDWGLQYFYGYLPTPAIRMAASAAYPYYTFDGIDYNRYHQIGADAAAVAGGFNLRTELAANLTEDTKGDDPYVYNPDIAFSLGFDRDIAAGVNLNLQYAGAYRLMNDKITSAFDIEADTDAFNSTLTAVVYQKLFQDKLEWRLTALWGVQDADFYLIPSASWTEGDAEVKLSAGIFGGDEAGELGQYGGSSYLKLALTYRF